MKHNPQFDLLLNPQKSFPSKRSRTSYLLTQSYKVILLVLFLLSSITGHGEGGGEEGAMLVFVPDKRSPLTVGHGGVRVQPQTLCTKEQKWLAKRREQ